MLVGGLKKRRIMASLAIQFCGRSPRKTERKFGFARDSVATGIGELKSGIRCMSNYSGRGRIKTEVAYPEIGDDIHDILREHSQIDPTFKSTLCYSKMTADKVRDILVSVKSHSPDIIPSRQTVGSILNRTGYRLRKVLKAKPIRKIKETDMIFDNVHRRNATADSNSKVLRISIDSKAKLKIGELSRGGKSRGLTPVKAQDHDTDVVEILLPFGISVVNSTRFDIFFGHSNETSDFIVDCMEKWWHENKKVYDDIEELVINLDNGPSINSNRTQFIKRMVNFTHAIRRTVRLIYYPPYHSKYNPVEHCWGALENYWNGAIMNSAEVALRWAQNMQWRGEHPTVYDMPGEYLKGISLTRKELKPFNYYFCRSSELPKWDITINP